MLQHKERIEVGCEVVAALKNSTSHNPEYQKKATASCLWEIHITGDLDSDNPSEAIALLHELQEQVNKIRAAYGYVTDERVGPTKFAARPPVDGNPSEACEILLPYP